MQSKGYAECGMFTEQWRSPAAPFNPDVNPKAGAIREAVRRDMESRHFYSTHSRPECAMEWRWLYEHYARAM